MRNYRREGRVIWLSNPSTGKEFGHEFDSEREARQTERKLSDHPLYAKR